MALDFRILKYDATYQHHEYTLIACSKHAWDNGVENTRNENDGKSCKAASWYHDVLWFGGAM
jgi:hypothetical protein